MPYKKYKNEESYLDLLFQVLTYGEERSDRTGVNTVSMFGVSREYNLEDEFPLITTKKVPFKSVLSELLWFIEGSGDERRLAEILYGQPREQLKNKKTIWSANADSDYWKPKSNFVGDLGRIYGVQWRSWTGVDGRTHDQLSSLITAIKNDPYSRRHILNAWNVGEIDQMALPPCHVMAQFYVTVTGYIDCIMHQRSADLFLGVPFNIASYSLLVYMIAAICDLKPGRFIHNIGDAHIYSNHEDAVRLQLERSPLKPPTLEIPKASCISEYSMANVVLHDYISHDAIKAVMAV